MKTSKKALLEFLARNSLFRGFADSQLEQIIPLMTEIKYDKDTKIIKEREVSDNIYLIKKGSVQISKWHTKSHQDLPLAVLGPNAVIGEIGILDEDPRSATASTLTPSTLIMLDVKRLRDMPNAQSTLSGSPLYLLLMNNIAKGVGRRIRKTNVALAESLTRELDDAKARIGMGIISVSTYVIIALYTLSLAIINRIPFQVISTTIISAPLLVLFTCIGIFTIKKSGYPLSLFGLTMTDWRESVKDALIFTTPFIGLTIVLKWVMIQTLPAWHNAPLFALSVIDDPAASSWLSASILMIYISLIFFQELLFRGILQTSIQEFFINRHKSAWAVFISSLLFSVTHGHVSLTLVFLTFIFGIFWGWLFTRHHSLIGVTLSHMILAVWALFIVGLS